MIMIFSILFIVYNNVSKLKLKIEGNLPKKEEVLITSYIARLIGNDLIGKKYYINDNDYYIISGIVEFGEGTSLSNVLFLNEDDINKNKLISYILPNDKNIIDLAIKYCDYYYNLLMASNQILQYQILGGIALFFIIIITLIFLIIYFYSSIYYKDKSINILINVGARKIDIFKMYLFNLLMSLFIAIIVSLPLYYFLSNNLDFNYNILESIALADFELLSFISLVVFFLFLGIMFIYIFINRLIYKKQLG